MALKLILSGQLNRFLFLSTVKDLLEQTQLPPVMVKVRNVFCQNSPFAITLITSLNIHPMS